MECPFPRLQEKSTVLQQSRVQISAAFPDPVRIVISSTFLQYLLHYPVTLTLLTEPLLPPPPHWEQSVSSHIWGESYSSYPASSNVSGGEPDRLSPYQ